MYDDSNSYYAQRGGKSYKWYIGEFHSLDSLGDELNRLFGEKGMSGTINNQFTCKDGLIKQFNLGVEENKGKGNIGQSVWYFDIYEGENTIKGGAICARIASFDYDGRLISKN